jgi:hypothetical protein
MPLHHIDLEAAFRRLAEKRIEDAMKEGKFENLEGAGKPLDLEPMPADENARLTWWALRILRNNDFTPHEVKWRKQIDLLKQRLDSARDAQHVTTLVTQINLLVKRVNTLGTNAMQSGVTGVSLDEELERHRARKSGTLT